MRDPYLHIKTNGQESERCARDRKHNLATVRTARKHRPLYRRRAYRLHTLSVRYVSSKDRRSLVLREIRLTRGSACH